MVEQESYSVREDFSQQPACKVPEVLGPHPLYGVASRKLTENGVDAVAKTAQQSASSGMGVRAFVLIGCEELDAYCGQLLLDLWRMVVAIPNEHTRGSFGDLRQHGKLVGVGWGYRKTTDDTRPANSHVHPEAVEGLFEEDVLAEGGLSSKTPTAIGSGEGACWQGKRVCQGEGGLMRGLSQQLLPEALLDLPEVGGLTAEGGAM